VRDASPIRFAPAAGAIVVGIATALLIAAASHAPPSRTESRPDEAIVAPTPAYDLDRGMGGPWRLAVEVVDVDEKPVPRASVEILRDPAVVGDHWKAADPPNPEQPLLAATCDDRGVASFVGVNTARYRVVVRAEGFATNVSGVPVARGVPAGPVRVMLLPEIPLRGRVCDEKGRPIASALVVASPSTATRGSISVPTASSWFRTGRSPASSGNRTLWAIRSPPSISESCASNAARM
jgi:hypothetical protein